MPGYTKLQLRVTLNHTLAILQGYATLRLRETLLSTQGIKLFRT